LELKCRPLNWLDSWKKARIGSGLSGIFARAALSLGSIPRQEAAIFSKPHSEDEVYYVLRRRSRCLGGWQASRRAAWDVALCRARRGAPLFFDITEDLTVLVFFAPAEGSRSQEQTALKSEIRNPKSGEMFPPGLAGCRGSRTRTALSLNARAARAAVILVIWKVLAERYGHVESGRRCNETDRWSASPQVFFLCRPPGL